jgi:hypothetical protein
MKTFRSDLFAFVAACVLTAAVLPSWAQAPAWIRSVNGPENTAAYLGDGAFITRALAVDGSGNIVATGSTSRAGQRDFLTTKLSGSSGAVVWQKTYAGPAGKDDDSLAVAVDPAGNALVAGLGFNAAGGIDIKVIKYAASDGAVLWERTIGGGTFNVAYVIAVDKSGNALVGTETNASGTSDIRVMKLAAASGAALWDQTFNAGRDDYLADLAVDASGNAVVAGVSVNAAGKDAMVILKFGGADGSVLWQQPFSGGVRDEAYGVALDSAGNAFVTGYSMAGENSRMMTLKFSAASGALLWQRAYDATVQSYGQAVAVDASGHALVTAQVRNARGDYDFKTLKYAGGDGALLWEKTFDGGADDYAYSIAADAAGNAVVVGSTTRYSQTDWRAIGYGAADGSVLFEYEMGGSANRNDDAYAVVTAPGAAFVGGTALESDTPTGARVVRLDYAATSTPTPPTTPAGGNLALASNGTIASASSTFGAGYPIAAIIDGDRRGTNWTAGGGWADGTVNAAPDWVQLSFGASRVIDRVVVYTLQDNYTSPVEPTDSMTFTTYGIVDFSVQGWNGSAWVTLGTVSGNNLVKRTVAFPAFTTDRIRIHVTKALGGVARITEVEAWGGTAAPAAGNVALASAGAVATASSTFGAGYPAAAVIDNERRGANWTAGGGWADGTVNASPDWLQVTFNGQKTIERVVVYTLQDNYTNPVEPTDAMTFTTYGVVDFAVQGWNGTAWVTLGTITGNNRVKRSVDFPAFTTDRIRIQVTRALAGVARITEVEAWERGALPARRNLALASAGAAATASSTFGPGYPVAAVIDDERAGARWTAGGGWADGTVNAGPDWVQVALNGSKAVDSVVVYTLQDNYANPVEPGEAMTFTTYGIVDFSVQAWDGASWVTLGTVSGNNLVKRTVTFPPFNTDRIRVLVTRALGGVARITEIEAWGR